MTKADTRRESIVRDVLEDAGMFSAASFGAVVAKYETNKKPQSRGLPSCPVVAFYGFRGGAGRTTALAHVAAFLAARQVSIVALDLDLEAPGLHHVLGCPEPEEGYGTLALLRTASTVDDPAGDDRLRLAPHLAKSALDVGAPIRVIPAGRLSPAYLSRLDDLGVPLWHALDGVSPLEAVVKRAREELAPDMICLDCRTGLNGLSASAVFHVADLVVCFLPVSKQSLDGIAILFKGLKAAKLNRHGAPDVLLVPSMVPAGREGKQRLDTWFNPALESLFAEIVLGEPISETNAAEIIDKVPLVREGIEYRPSIALVDALDSDFVQRSSGAYQGLLVALDRLLKTAAAATPARVDSALILEQLGANADLKDLAFAESTDPQTIVQKFIPPQDFKAILDRSTWYVVGAKGAGKTWLWQYLLSPTGGAIIAEQGFVAAHGSKEALLSSSAFRELEKDKSLSLEKRGLHGALWLFYAANRVLADQPTLAAEIAPSLSVVEKTILKLIAAAKTSATLLTALTRALAHEQAGTLSERLIRTLDAALLQRGPRLTILLYDGLDTGFGSEPADIERRTRYVNALVEAIEPLRGVSKRLGFKVFLREDVHSAIGIQNQSHLSAATIELKWSPSDLWRLALNLVSASAAYMTAVKAIDPSAGPGQWPVEEERRRSLLVPLWGDEMEQGNKVSTATFVQRRTSDGKDRLFPRTLVQLLAAATNHQRETAPGSDRVLRSVAVQKGYADASAKRVEDLRNEYSNLKDYLDALKGRAPTGTEKELIDHLKKGVTKVRRPKGAKGAPAGALHAGPGGWHGVIERLLEVGVLREYRRARGDAGEKKYEIALLYRPGLGLRAYGV